MYIMYRIGVIRVVLKGWREKVEGSILRIWEIPSTQFYRGRRTHLGVYYKKAYKNKILL
jgi:hypothetical protein